MTCILYLFRMWISDNKEEMEDVFSAAVAWTGKKRKKGLLQKQ